MQGFCQTQTQNKPKKKVKFNYLRNPEKEINIYFTPTYSALQSNKFTNENKYNNSYMFGADWGQFFGVYNKFKFGWSVGLNFSRYAAQKSYSFNDTIKTIDPDRDILLIHENADISETQKLYLLELPIMFKT